MCGIVGMIGQAGVVGCLINGLKRLEYRGYDSAGLAVVVDGQIIRRRAEGKLVHLESVLQQHPLEGSVGIAHTRWATHGVPNERNAHPHMSDQVAVVHNGIIENFKVLRDELEAQGCVFETDTDTEVVVHLLTQNLKNGLNPEQAMKNALDRLEGAFALGIVFRDYPHMLMGARRGCPLAIGLGDAAMYLSSDPLGFAGLTDKVIYLDEGDWVVAEANQVTIYNNHGQRVNRPVQSSFLSGAMIGKGHYRHYMEKEIFEQPAVLGDTIQAYVDPMQRLIRLPELPFALKNVERLTLSACGTAYIACHIAKYWIEHLARLPVEIDIASEFRYREAPMVQKGCAVFVSQSGETADTLAALRYCREHGQHILSVVNVPHSTIARESDQILKTYAGPEIGVASTKAFTAQLAVLLCFAMGLAKAKGCLSVSQEVDLVQHLIELPSKMTEVLKQTAKLQTVAHRLSEARDVLYLGRGLCYPLALEGALKLKEISYIHAEGYAAGEMKHGPIALIDENVPVVMIAPHDGLFDKLVSNLEQVVARGGRVILISSQNQMDRFANQVVEFIGLPDIHPLLAPILYALPIQLLAYYTAVVKGTDVDQPRNLAKSVTVE